MQPSETILTSSKYSKSSREAWLDVLRIFATVMVTYIHAKPLLPQDYDALHATYWWISNLLESFARCITVPCFFMIAGYCYLGRKPEPILQFYKKRLFKIILPFLGASYVFLFLRYMGGEALTLKGILFMPFFHATADHLWFMYAMIGFYIIMPFLNKLLATLALQETLIFLGIWWTATILIPFIGDITYPRYTLYFQPWMMTPWLGYAIIGYLLNTISISRRIFITASLVFCICLLATLGLTAYLTITHNSHFNGLAYNFNTPIIVIASSCAMIIAKYLLPKNTPSPLLAYFSDRMYAVYLLHPVIIYLIQRKIIWMPTESLQALFLFTSTIMLFALTLVFVMLLHIFMSVFSRLITK